MQNWQWRLQDSQTLVIELGKNLIHPLEFKRSFLRDRLPESVSFSMDDAAAFQRFSDYLEDHSTLPASEQFNIALHAAALVRFGKIMLPQSWYFQFGPFSEEKPWPQTHLFCSLISGPAQADFLVVEQDERCSLCLLVDESFELGGFKTMRRFEVTRVLNDRLQESLRHPMPRMGGHSKQWA
ncbi:cell division protein ZapC [Aliidiomarina halalkaliphila]|uniref:Cell division protein ZapC n=1 Tax=Aliidiomarina halalkaliphila TaxID=2593535 RepID=A0A552X3X7_9GAMM|nr:cell division protein ZapC domain-containing protein [Aliidiomarina halalkaliphila]TRW49732.1 cell division protein ZapC [Aliidiomarina halalkaliphila]